MTRELCWDGLRVDIPDAMEPAVLDRGFVRLVPVHRAPGDGALYDLPAPTLDLRFGTATSPFSPDRDGRRLLKASGMAGGALAPFRPAWGNGRDLWIGPDDAPRLFVTLFRGGIVAALFSSAPDPELLRSTLGPLDWVAPDAWRSWRCYDLSLETPPGAALASASFRPGAFRLEFRLGGSTITFDRLAPADVLLNGDGLGEWLRRFALREHGKGLAVSAAGPSEASFERPLPAWRRAVPWIPAGPDRVHGRARLTANRLLVLTERGRPVPRPDFERMYASHAAATIQS